MRMFFHNVYFQYLTSPMEYNSIFQHFLPWLCRAGLSEAAK